MKLILSSIKFRFRTLSFSCSPLVKFVALLYIIYSYVWCTVVYYIILEKHWLFCLIAM